MVAPDFVEPSDEDKATAAAMFADDSEPEPDLDTLAGEAAFMTPARP